MYNTRECCTCLRNAIGHGMRNADKSGLSHVMHILHIQNAHVCTIYACIRVHNVIIHVYSLLMYTPPNTGADWMGYNEKRREKRANKTSVFYCHAV